MGLLDQLQAYMQANTPRSTRPVAKPSDVINAGLLNPNQYNAPAANRFKDSALGLLGGVPGAGDYASGVQAADYWNRGEKGNAMLAGLGALPMVPAMGGIIKAGKDLEPFGMHHESDLGDILLTESAKNPGQYQLTMYDGLLGQSNPVRDEQFLSKEEAIKAFNKLKGKP